MKQITSTELSLKTRQTIQHVKETGEPIIISTYNQPQVVLVDFEEWKKKNRNMISDKKIKKTRAQKWIEESRKYRIDGDFPDNDVTKYIRKMRDEE